jgi:hypothetical protein
MVSDTKLFHGTDSTAYRVSERIRFGHNRFFLKLLAQVRDGRAFNQTDRVLDVGCGDAPYFDQLWNKVVPEFGRPSFILGIDSEKIRGRDAIAESDACQLRQVDLFDFDGHEQWDVVYSSFCHAWLRAPRKGEETETDRDNLIGSKLQTLIRPGGWFAAHYPGKRDFFPYYNRLVVAALKRIGDPLGDRERYFAFRDCQLRVPESLESIRASFRKHEFVTRALLKTIEWIPVRRETEFLAYWESGGRRLLEGKLGFEQYGRFREALGDLVADADLLASLGVKTFSEKGEFVLLPTFHVYHVAQRQPTTKSSMVVTANKHESSSIQMPLKAIAEFQANAGEESKKGVEAVAKVISDFLKLERAAPVYLAVIEAGGTRRLVECSWYADAFQNRRHTVDEGRELKLPTFTNAIFRLRGKRPKVASLAHVTDRSSGTLYRVTGESEGARQIQRYWIEMTFLWPQDMLHSLFDQNVHPLTQDALLGMLERLRVCNDWPRLIVESDSAFDVAQELEANDLNSDLSGPLRYFLWQSRVGGPKPFCFLVFPQRLERLGVEGSQTCFLMWQEPERHAPHVTETECALLLAMQPLAMMEIAEEAQKHGEIHGREDVWDAFSHETQQAAQAMQKFWSLPLNKQELEALLPVIRKRFPNVPNKLSLLPFPDVLESAAFLVQLWATARSPLFLFSKKQPTTVLEVARVAWNLARDSIKAALPLHNRRDEIFLNAPRWLRKIDEVWSFDRWVTVREPHASLDEVLQLSKWLNDFTKLLIALFRNIIQHAHPSKPASVLLDVSSGFLAISISSHKDNLETNGFQGEFQAINEARIKRRRQEPIGSGAKVIKQLVEGDVLKGKADSWEPYNATLPSDDFAITIRVPLTQ